MNTQRFVSLATSAAIYFLQAQVVFGQEKQDALEIAGAKTVGSKEGAIMGMSYPYPNNAFSFQIPGQGISPLIPYQSSMGQMPFSPMPFPPQPGMPIQPFSGGMVPVSVQGDATYLVAGPVCSGYGIAPVGIQCPRAGMSAVAGCFPNIPSNRGFGNCIAPVNAVCVQVHFNTWGCAFENGMGRVPSAQPWMQGPVPPLGLPMQQMPFGGSAMNQMPLGGYPMRQMPLGGYPMQQMSMGMPMAQSMPFAQTQQFNPYIR